MEARQRLFLFDEQISKLSGIDASRAFRLVLEKGWTQRSPSFHAALETAALATAARIWHEAHRLETFEAALAMQDRLVSLIIGSDFLYGDPPPETEVPVPAYARDRTLSLGERKSIARKPDRKYLAAALRDPHPEVIQRLLSNPRLTESDAVFIAARRPVPPAVLTELGCHPKWRVAERVAFALISNPHTPLRISLSLLHNVGRPRLRELMAATSIAEPVRDALSDLAAFK